jgi:hypothetical protein
VAIGPARDFPSWHWCGGDLVAELRFSHDIQVFRWYYELALTNPDAVVIVKAPPSAHCTSNIKSTVYLPVDFFESEKQIQDYDWFLRSCDVVATHCARLDEHIRPHCSQVAHVKHYGKHVLPEMAEYKPAGFVLWMGQGKYVKNALGWHGKSMRGFKLVLLTNDCGWDWGAPAKAGIFLDRWSEEKQLRLLGEAKAGLDIKGLDFEQMMKPPTKAQQFVASGVPVAVNHESYSWEWFHARGFDLADPDDEKRWFSRRYWEETRDFGLHLRDEISKRHVVSSYLDLLHDSAAHPTKDRRDRVK